jgi:iron(III) transport system ATP-binding protein
MTNPVWSLKEVTLAGRVRPRLVDVSLEIPAGVSAVMGSSGAGKSSLLGLLADFEKPDDGTVTFHNPGSQSSLPLFWSPQDDGLWPHLSVQQHIDYVRPSKPCIDRSALQWLELFRLGSLKDSLPELLSQGERSRLAVARTLASEASVIVMDEPLVHVDPMLAHECWEVIAEHIQQNCSAVVFSTHDPDTVLKYAQHVICLQDGAAEFCGPVEALYFEPPTKPLAWLLGPCNWFDDDSGWSVCVRPSELEVRLDVDGQFVVESFAAAATVSELKLRDHVSGACRDVFVSRMASEVRAGETVQLTFLPRPDRPKS